MVEEISATELQERLAEDGPQVVDIRPSEAYEDGHIPGAINVPLTELPGRVDDVDWAEEVVTVCPIGQSSIQAARLIGSYEGADDAEVVSLAGGYRDWDGELESGTADQETPL